MKKIIPIILIFILIVSISVGATFAYLTDRDSEVNTFTMGNVDIELKEDFQQGAQLKPDLDINKDVQIQNTGNNDAWVWYTYAIPAALDSPGNASGNVLHVNHAGANWLGYQNNQNFWEEGQTEATPEDQCWIVDYNPQGNGNPVDTVDVNGVAYHVYAVLYNGILPVNKITTVGLTKVYLDAHVDIDPDGQVYLVKEGIATKVDWNLKQNLDTVIFVNAYAVQARGFASVFEAYEGYLDQWGSLNGEMQINRQPNVGSLEQLQTALEEGWEQITLTNDIQLSGDVTGTFRSEGIELIYGNQTASIEIYGGHFSNPKPYQMLNLKDGQSARITTYGGTYVNQNPSATGDGNFVPAGYKVISNQLDNGNIEYTVIPE